MWLCDHVLPPSLPVLPAVSISFQPNRTQPLYAGTPVTLVCAVTVDKTLVDTDIMANFDIRNLVDRNITSGGAQFNASTFQGEAQFGVLLPSDDNILYLCTSAFFPVDNTSYVDSAATPTVTSYTLSVAGEVAVMSVWTVCYMFPCRPAPSQCHSGPPNTDHCWGPPHTHLHCHCGGVSGHVPSPAMADS